MVLLPMYSGYCFMLAVLALCKLLSAGSCVAHESHKAAHQTTYAKHAGEKHGPLTQPSNSPVVRPTRTRTTPSSSTQSSAGACTTMSSTATSAGFAAMQQQQEQHQGQEVDQQGHDQQDVYGFPLVNLTPQQQAAQAACALHEERRRVKWQAYNQQQHLPAGAKLKRYCRKVRTTSSSSRW
eukprot:GHRR01032473.1.p1 GENE.GHRR01032473.1~~GHRR01032473.1.p1  ORF type:complete len:181 (+),score=43.35 GHRR01032473.1:609-1151(+)